MKKLTDKTDCLIRARLISKRLNKSSVNHYYPLEIYYKLIEKL